MAVYYWDEWLGKYRDERGRFVARSVVESWLAQGTKASSNVGDFLASSVANGNISPAAWLDAFKQEIKDEYIRQYMTMVGGRDFMTPSDWGKIGQMVREQYSYLPGFVDAIAQGKLSEAQIRARSAMYINSAREAKETARAAIAARLGMDEVFWGINAALENCKDCLYFYSLGWQKVEDDPYEGAVPGSGDTVCLTSCGCGLEYRRSIDGVAYEY